MAGTGKRRWLSSRVLVPAIISAGLVAFLLGVSDLKTLRQAIFLPPLVIGWMFGLTIVFLAAKGVVWYWLVRRAEITAHWREITFSFLGGEITKMLPGGIYFQNYLLGKLSGHPAAFGVATSLVLVGMEAAVTMLFVLGFGIRGWPWLRPLLLGFSAGWIGLLLILWKSGLVGHLEEWSKGRHPIICRVMRQADLLYQGLRKIWHPGLWAELLALTAVYLFTQCVELWLITVSNPKAIPLSLPEASAATAFSLLVPMMLPVPVQLGFAELTGTGALIAMGMPYNKAIALMFAFRVWSTGALFPVALPVMLGLFKEWKRAMEPSPQQKDDKAPGSHKVNGKDKAEGNDKSDKSNPCD